MSDRANFSHLETHEQPLCRTCGRCETCECSCGAPVEDWQDRPTRRITSIADLRAGARYRLAGAELVGIRKYAYETQGGIAVYSTCLGTDRPERNVSDVISRIGLAEFFRAGGAILEMAPPPEETEGEA